MAETKTTAGTPRGALDRPMSPHLQVWRWHVTMWTSILNRATGVALYGGAFILAAWAIALAMGPEAYECVMGLLASPLGLLVLFGLTWSLLFHLANGVRHLVWDLGFGLAIPSANLSGWVVIIGSVVATVLVWIAAFAMGIV